MSSAGSQNSCAVIDQIELACIKRCLIDVLTQSGDRYTGVAVDTRLDEQKQDSLVLEEVDGDTLLLPLSSVRAIEFVT